MGISGNLKTMVLAELLQWLSQGQKTGTLVIDNDSVKKKIFFENGTIVSSASTDPKEYLGHFLASHGYIDDDDIEKALALQKEQGGLIGTVLINMGLIDNEVLEEVLLLKAEESIYDIFTWEEGDFRFLDQELPEDITVRLEMDVQWLVLEGSRRMDEWGRIKERVPSLQCIPVSVCDLSTLEKEEVTLRILSWIDDKMTVEEISHSAKVTSYQVAQIIAETVEEGYVKAIEPRIIEVPVPAAQASQPPPQQQQPPPPQQQQDFPPPQPAGGQPFPPTQQVPQYRPETQTVMLPGYGPPPGHNPAAMPPPTQSVSVGDRTLHFAGTGEVPIQAGPGGNTAPTMTLPQQDTAPAPKEASPSEGLVQEMETLIQRGELREALRFLRQMGDDDPQIAEGIKICEAKLQRALENHGLLPGAVPKLQCSMEELTQLDISPEEGFLLTRINGSYDIKSILKMSPVSKLDAQILFWRLKKTGHIGF